MKTFGAAIRSARLARGIGLRRLAEYAGISATYLSKLERDESTRCSEATARRLAELLGLDADNLLALAGRLSADLVDIVTARPHLLARLIRATTRLSDVKVLNLVRAARNMDRK